MRFCSLARISPTFCSVASLHRFPSSQRPCLSSDAISTEWVLFALQRRALQQPDSRGLLLVAAYVAPGRQPWASCRDAAPRINTPREFGRLERVRPRQEARPGGPALCWLPRNPAKKPTQASTTRLVRSALCQHAENLPASRPTFTSIAPRGARASVGNACALFGASGQPGRMPNGLHTGIKTLSNQ